MGYVSYLIVNYGKLLCNRIDILVLVILCGVYNIWNIDRVYF